MRTMSNVTKRKATGAHFTPPLLARFVAGQIIKAASLKNGQPLRVLDPACGDGELLLAFAESLPEGILQHLELNGIETDDQALVKASDRLQKVPVKNIQLRKADFLAAVLGKRPIQPSLLEPYADPPQLGAQPDIVIANPPYVRTQILGSQRAQELAGHFGLSGRVDLYHAFLVAMTEYLRPEGILGVITSNRFLSTEGAQTLRSFLTEAYEILEVYDLGDTKLFIDAAVLPAVFLGRKRKPHELMDRRSQKPSFVRVYEQPLQHPSNMQLGREARSLYSILLNPSNGTFAVGRQRYEVSTGTFETSRSGAPWQLIADAQRPWLQTVHSKAALSVQDVARVRVGVKTTADEVFIRDDWDYLPNGTRPESDLLRVLVSQENARKWTPLLRRERVRKVLYTHQSRDGKRRAIDLSEYPRAKAYLELHRARLEGRRYLLEARRNWYEIWVPQNPAEWCSPKIVFPDISDSPKFFYDPNGCVVDGNCYWITTKGTHDSELLFLILGVANSRLIQRYYDIVFNNRLYSGRRRHLTQYVERYPLPDPTSSLSQTIVDLTKLLVLSPVSAEDQEEIEKELDVAVEHAFGVPAIHARHGLKTAFPT